MADTAHGRMGPSPRSSEASLARALVSLVPDMIRSGFAAPAQIGAIGTAQLIGIFIGTVGQGEFADRFGSSTCASRPILSASRRCRSHLPRPNRPQVIQSADCFVDAQGLMYLTDSNAGLTILQFEGA